MFYEVFGSAAVKSWERGNGPSLLAGMGETITPQKRPRCDVSTPETEHEKRGGLAKLMRSRKAKDDEPEPESDCIELPSPCAGEEAARSSTGAFRPEDAWQTCRSCQYPTLVRIDFWNRTGTCDPPMKHAVCLCCSGLLPIPDR